VRLTGSRAAKLRALAPLMVIATALAARSANAEPPPLALAAELGAPDTVITGGELRTYGAAFYELEEALAAREGITFLSSGDVGSEDWILVRGFPRDSSRNVLVLLDGAPINNGAYEGVEAHDLPASHIDRVEVYRPPLPARFGGYHAVLAFYTKPGLTRPGVTAQASGAVGSLSTGRASAAAMTAGKNWSADLSVAVLSTDALSGRYRTPPFENLRYEDRSYSDWAPTARVGWQPGRDTMVSGFVTFSNGEKRFSDDELRTRWFVLGGVLAAHRISEVVTVRAAVHGGYERYFLRLRMHPDVGLQFRRRVGGRVEAVLTPAPITTTVVGAEAADRRLDERGTLAGHTTFALFAEERLRPAPVLDIGGGIRLEGAKPEHGDFGHGHDLPTGLAWSADATTRPWRSGSLGFRVGRTLRWPALGEYGAHQDLDSEILTGGELRAKQSFCRDKLTLGAAVYVLRLEREIGLGASGFDENLPHEIRSRGVEGRADFRWTHWLSTYATYTLSEATTSSGDPVAYGPPRHMGSAGVLVDTDGTSGRVSARYLGKKDGILRHMGDEGLVQDALVVDLFAERKVVRGLSAFAQASNLLNLTYETFQGRPMLPRTVLVGVTVEESFP
jgi:outer membrane cobalamin receptor